MRSRSGLQNWLIGQSAESILMASARRLGKQLYRLPNNSRQLLNVGLMKQAQATILHETLNRARWKP